MKVSFFKHSLARDELNNIAKVFKSETLSTGSFCKKFEKLFSNRFKVKFCSTFSSWTMGSYTLLKSLNFNKGDEVIVSPLTWVSSINTIVLSGATPIFVDVDLKTGLIDPESIRDKISKKTKAIIVVHLYGQMCDMRKISKICKKDKIKIIEDCAHCLEGKRNNILPGQLSYAAIFSFYATKNITCGEGGAVITNNKKLDRDLKLARYHGRNNKINDKLIYNHWDIEQISLKSNLTDLSASILIPQLGKINQNWNKRKLIWDKFNNFFKKYKDIRILDKCKDSKHSMHLYTFLVSPNLRDKILKSLIKKRIGTSVHYRSISELRYYKKKILKKNIPNAIEIGRSTITLPFYPELKIKEINYILNSLKQIFLRYKIN